METFRGEGIFQRAVDIAIEKLRAGAWVRRVQYRALNCDPISFSLFLCRYTCLEKVKFVNPIRTKADPQTAMKSAAATHGRGVVSGS